MANTQSTRTHKTSDDQNLAALERKVRRWELEDHIQFKMLSSPPVAAAILALCGAVITGWLSWQNAHLEAEVEAAKQENALIIEVLRADPSRASSELKAMVNAGLLPVFGEKLREAFEAGSQIKVSAPAK